MKSSILRIFTVAKLLLLSSALFADSDGSYCHCGSYFAYQMQTAEGKDETVYHHLLKIIQFGPGKGFVPVSEMRLPYFTVHAMACTRTAIYILGWNILYVVDISDIIQPRLFDQISIPDQTSSLARVWKTRNMSHWSKEGLHTLDTLSNGNVVVLEVIKKLHGKAGQVIHHDTTTRLVMKDPNGKMLMEFPLFKGRFDEYID
jgi:hypothetical protein